MRPQCDNDWVLTSNIEEVLQPQPRNIHNLAIISSQVPGEQRGLMARPVVKQGVKKLLMSTPQEIFHSQLFEEEKNKFQMNVWAIITS